MNDDLPWPELGNVSRGATRGNQGQKGVLGAPDSEGRAVLQLRVQPGVLAVRLNRQATEWYRALDAEVNHALKLTKTYWRKARRRQDYDARADQDHMELHEWLQQLKDKVMTHLELLMQKGEIQGPPYIMPDHLELTFLRKFIERQAARIPHNPRLRQAYLEGGSPRVPHYSQIGSSEGSSTPASTSWADDKDESMEDQLETPPPTASAQSSQNLLNDLHSSQRALRNARAILARAQRDTTEAFSKYKAYLDAETRARQAVTEAEEHRDSLMSSLVDAYRAMGLEVPEITSNGASTSRESAGISLSSTTAQSSVDQQQRQRSASSSIIRQDVHDHWDHTQSSRPRSQSSAVGTSVESQDYDARFSGMTRKHSRSWEMPQGQSVYENPASHSPRKRHSGSEDYERSPVFRYTAAFPSPSMAVLSRPSYSLHSSPMPPHSHLPSQLTV